MTEEVYLFVAVGFLAQMIDGAIGMAYGVTATSVLLGMGVAPVTASACIHAAETFTTGASGLAHWRFGNVDLRLVARLAIPGAIGGAIGAYVLSSLPGDVVRPYVSAYLLALGLLILWKARRPRGATASATTKPIVPLGLVGGFLDSIGGGGWGPIVTSSLLGQGAPARTTIGSVCMAEFFVTLTISLTFLATVGLDLWPIITGLIIGGVLAAPLAALVTKYLPERALMAIVGVVVVLLSLRGIAQALY
ncbi:MAG: sulfite exporter TauE/SafE family protein [Hyphomicrobiaceae bacterium]|nr:sulfite exporter TauE/SafE family protein [Hyphomicrobiaceae bacterium]